MMIWNFTSGFQKTTYTQVKMMLFISLMINAIYAGEQKLVTKNGDIPSVELLELLGQFELEDGDWFDNEVNNEISEKIEKTTDEKANE